MGFLKHQIARYAGGLPLYAVPQLTGTPYIGPDQQPGDVVDFVDAPITSVVYPTPSTSHTIFVNGVNKGATPYTITTADVTAGSLSVLQHTGNPLGFSEATSVAINPISPPTAWAQGLMGGNTGGATEYSRNQFLNNAGQCGRQFYAAGSNTVFYSGSYDANGWPAAAFTYLFTAKIGGMDGQLLAGTYQCSYRSVGQATTVSAYQQCTVSNITNLKPGVGTNDGVTTYFTLTLPFNSDAMLAFNGAVQYVDIPRDGVTYTYGGPEFWPTALAYYAQFSTLRWMDVCRPSSSTEILWSDRLSNGRTEYGPTQPGVSTSYSWNRIFRLFNALTSYSGSRVTKAHIALPGLIDATVANANNYAYQLATLANTVLGANPIELDIEVGDEPWNATLGGSGVVFQANLHGAQTECKVITQSPGTGGGYASDGNPIITSIVSNGDGTATVTTNVPLNAITNKDGTTFAITNGMAVVVNCQTLNTTWGAGSIVQNANPLLNATVNSVTVTVPSPTGTTFTYPINGGAGVTNGTACPTLQMAFFFNLTSNLLLDGGSLNLYDMGAKSHTRRLYQVCQAWKSVRPQDNFLMNLAQYTNASSIQAQYPYSRYIAGTLSPWAYASCVAPYVYAQVSGCSGVAGNSFITNCPFVSTAQVGDSISIAIGFTTVLTTTVAPGSSGTTLQLAAALPSTSSNFTVTGNSGPAASFAGYIVGNTLTVTSTSSGTVAVGMMFNSTPSTAGGVNVPIPYGARITGGSGSTFTLSISANVGSAGSPLNMTAANTDGIVGMMQAAIPSFVSSLAAHIYQCNLYGFRPMCYEGGTDSTQMPNQQIAINTNPAMTQLLTSLFNAWYSQGGKEFQNYGVAPSLFTNTAQGEWSYSQDFSDTSSPRLAAVLGYTNQALNYGSVSSSPMAWTPGGSAGAYIDNGGEVRVGLNFNAVSGMVFSSASTNDRYIDRMFLVGRGRRYQLVVKCSSTAADVINVSVDGTNVGSITCPVNGDGANNATVPGTVTLNLTLTRGARRIRLDMPATTCANAGVFSAVLQTY